MHPTKFLVVDFNANLCKLNYYKDFIAMFISIKVLFSSWCNKNTRCFFLLRLPRIHPQRGAQLSKRHHGEALSSSSTIIPIITPKKKEKKNCHFSSFTFAGMPDFCSLHVFLHPAKHGSCVTSQLCSAWTGSEAWRVEDRGHSYVCRHWAIEEGYHWGMGRAVGCMRRGANSALLWALPG